MMDITAANRVVLGVRASLRMTARGAVWSACAVLMLSALTGVAEAQRAAGLQMPSPQALSRVGLERAWIGHAEMNAARDHMHNISGDEEVVFVQSTSGITTAFDAEDGRRLWSIQLGQFDEPAFPVTTNDKTAMIAVGIKIYGIEKRTGVVLWTIRLPGQPAAAPSIDEKRLYVGTLDGSVYAYSLDVIRRLYERQMLPKWQAESLIWRYRTGKDITSPPIPIAKESFVLFASRDRSMYAVTSSDRNLVYQVFTNAQLVAPLAFSGDRAYLASEDYSFRAIRIKDGRTLWEFTSGLPIRKKPHGFGDYVFILPERGGLHCRTAALGEEVWPPRRGISDFLSYTQDSVYTLDLDRNLHRIRMSDGASMGTVSMAGFDVRYANEKTDRIILGTDSGAVICLRQQQRRFPLYHMNPDQRPIVPDVAREGEPDGDGEKMESEEDE